MASTALTGGRLPSSAAARRTWAASSVVPIVKFLATEGWWITAQTIFANGGYTTR